MITKVKSKKSDVSKYFHISKSDYESVDLNKKKLFELAESGQDKPHWKTKLGKAFIRYTCKSYRSCDNEFIVKFKKIRPDWFIDKRIQIANEKKALILKIATEGGNKPSSKTKLGRCYIKYTAKSAETYDPSFIEELKKIRPDWFMTLVVIASHKKKILIQMAKNGKNRPNQKTKIGQAFSSYVSKSNGAYDADFKQKIKNINPNWFIPIHVQNGNKKKEALIQMAKDGEKKPSISTSLGLAFRSYTINSSHCRDAVFTDTIKSIRPDWFKR